jgi:5'-3' exonuclease
MGIHYLLPFLKKRAPSTFRSFSEWKSNRNQLKIAIDTPIFMYKFAYAVGTGTALCERMIKFIEELRNENIEPIFVFDGSDLPEKKEESNKRLLKRKECNGNVIISCFGGDIEMEVEGARTESETRPTSKDYDLFLSACNSMKILHMKARYEAEALCAYLNATGIVDGVLTEDSDALAYGCKNVIYKWGHEPQVASAEEAAKCLSMNMIQWIEFCVLLGNDFNPRIHKMGPVKSSKMILNHTLEEIIIKEQVCLADSEKMRLSFKIFKTFCSENILEPL